MTWIIDTKSKRQLSAKFAAGIVISAMSSCGGYYSDMNSGYYNRAPPVVYGSPYGSSYYSSRYYYSPPVIYPSLNIGVW